jgi:hypothetical protein
MSNAFAFLAQSNTGSSGGSAVGGAVFGLVELVVTIFVIAGIWKVFVKAGHPGWAAIIPIYNFYILMKIAGRPAWWLLLLFIPLVNIIIGIILSIDVAKRFGKGTGFGIGLALLGFVFYPILGFGDAQYTPPTGEARGFPVIPITR